MPGMTKKKPQRGEKPDPKKDRHAPHKMMRVPLAFHKILRELALEDMRTMSLELLVALSHFFRSRGREPPSIDR